MDKAEPSKMTRKRKAMAEKWHKSGQTTIEVLAYLKYDLEVVTTCVMATKKLYYTQISQLDTYSSYHLSNKHILQSRAFHTTAYINSIHGYTNY